MIEWQNIDTVLLDMDGTLLDLHFDNYFWQQHLPLKFAEREQISYEQAMSQLAPEFERHQGQIKWYCTDHWSEYTQFDIIALKRQVTERIGWRPSAVEFLKWLNTQDKHIVIATNAHRDVFNLKAEHTQLQQYVHQVISSHDYQSPKEEQYFWQQLQLQLGFDANRTLLIDDSLAVLRSAKRFGIGHLLSIAQPDSQAASRVIDEFLALNDFVDIMPANAK